MRGAADAEARLDRLEKLERRGRASRQPPYRNHERPAQCHGRFGASSSLVRRAIHGCPSTPGRYAEIGRDPQRGILNDQHVAGLSGRAAGKLGDRSWQPRHGGETAGRIAGAGESYHGVRVTVASSLPSTSISLSPTVAYAAVEPMFKQELNASW
jgi:hypothetical protein